MQKIKLTFVLAMILFIAGCKKTNNDIQANISDVIPITSQSAAKQVAYAETNLKKIGTEIAKLTKDPAFVSFIHNEVNKKFDQEYEVLIENLKKNPIWSSKLNNKNLNEGLAAFKNIGGSDGGNYFPQIYLPKFQHEEDNNINNVTSNNTSNVDGNEILYMFYGGNAEIDTTQERESFPAYIKDASDSLIYWGQVNEEYANTHEVWVFSLNELVPNQFRLALPAEPCEFETGQLCGGGGGTGGGGGGTGGGGSNPDTDPTACSRTPHPDMGYHAPVNCKIENMSLRRHNESWLSGGSEVCIRAVLNCQNNRTYGGAYPTANFQYQSNQESNYLGRLIQKFTRRQVNNGTILNVNYPLQTAWPTNFPLSDPIFFDYVIFERDIWPTSLNHLSRSGRFDPAPFNQTESYDQWYRSADVNYDFGTITNNSSYPGQFYNGGTFGNPYYFMYFTTKAF